MLSISDRSSSINLSGVDAVGKPRTIGLDLASPERPIMLTQVAGHAANFVSLGDGRIVKIMGANEFQAYSQYGAKLNGIVPKAQEVVSSVIKELTQEQQDKIRQMRPLEPDEKAVILDEVGASYKEAMQLDVKLGKSTASKTLLAQEGHPSPQKKKIKMSALDVMYGSRNRSYRLEGTSFPEAQKAGQLNSRARTNKYIAKIIRDIPFEQRNSAIDKIVTQAQATQKALNALDVTFVGSSLYASISKDEESMGEVDIKLIDLAHPVRKAGENDLHYDRKQLYFNRGIDAFIGYLKSLK